MAQDLNCALTSSSSKGRRGSGCCGLRTAAISRQFAMQRFTRPEVTMWHLSTPMMCGYLRSWNCSCKLCDATSRGWSYTGFIFVDEADIPYSGHRAKACPAIAGRILDALIRAEAVLAQSSVIVRRSLLAKVGGYDASMYLCGDYELWMRLAQESEIDFIDQPLVRVRRHREHCGSDVAALEDLALILKRMQRSNLVPHLHSTLQRRRATVSAQLARSHSISSDRLAVLGTLLRDARFSWRYWNWWFTGLTSTARVFAPEALVSMLRTYRRKSA